jgi:hypothetical protein
MYPIEYRTSVGKNGHLSWDWMNFKGYEIILAILYLLFYIKYVYIVDLTCIFIFLCEIKYIFKHVVLDNFCLS